MALDAAKNFAKVQVSTGYDADDTSIVLETGHGARLPTAPFNVVWWNASDYADPADDPNREIVRVTAITDDTLTVTRAQEGTSGSTKNTAGKTYLMIAGPTAKLIDDIETALAGAGGALGYGAKAYRNSSTQAVPTSSTTKIQLNAEAWDLAGEYDPTTNFRYTATTEGYYLVTFAVFVAAAVADKFYSVFPVKNGGSGVAQSEVHSSSTSELTVSGAGMVYLDVGDYLELFMFHNAGSNATVNPNEGQTYMTVQRVY